MNDTPRLVSSHCAVLDLLAVALRIESRRESPSLWTRQGVGPSLNTAVGEVLVRDAPETKAAPSLAATSPIVGPVTEPNRIRITALAAQTELQDGASKGLEPSGITASRWARRQPSSPSFPIHREARGRLVSPYRQVDSYHPQKSIPHLSLNLGKTITPSTVSHPHPTSP